MTRPPPAPSYFEDLEVGAEWSSAERRVDGALVAAFAELSGDRSPIHLDPNAARRAGYPTAIAHGALVTALAVGLVSERGDLQDTTLALARMEWKFAQPVLVGAAIHCRVIVAARRALGESAGIIRMRVDLIGEDGLFKQRGRLDLVVRRRPPLSVPAGSGDRSAGDEQQVIARPELGKLGGP